MSRHTGSHAFLLVSIFAWLLFFSFSLSTLAQESETQADIRINVTIVLSVAVIPASGDVSYYCRVLSIVRSAINFEIRPTTDWNIKFRMPGCGGYCCRMVFGGDLKIGRGTANPTVINQPNQQ